MCSVADSSNLLISDLTKARIRGYNICLGQSGGEDFAELWSNSAPSSIFIVYTFESFRRAIFKAFSDARRFFFKT